MLTFEQKLQNAKKIELELENLNDQFVKLSTIYN